MWSKNTRSQIQRQSMRSPNTVIRSTTNWREGGGAAEEKNKGKKEGQAFHKIKDTNDSGKPFSSETPT